MIDYQQLHRKELMTHRVLRASYRESLDFETPERTQARQDNLEGLRTNPLAYTHFLDTLPWEYLQQFQARDPELLEHLLSCEYSFKDLSQTPTKHLESAHLNLAQYLYLRLSEKNETALALEFFLDHRQCLVMPVRRRVKGYAFSQDVFEYHGVHDKGVHSHMHFNGWYFFAPLEKIYDQLSPAAQEIYVVVALHELHEQQDKQFRQNAQATLPRTHFKPEQVIASLHVADPALIRHHYQLNAHLMAPDTRLHVERILLHDQLHHTLADSEHTGRRTKL